MFAADMIVAEAAAPKAPRTKPQGRTRPAVRGVRTRAVRCEKPTRQELEGEDARLNDDEDDEEIIASCTTSFVKGVFGFAMGNIVYDEDLDEVETILDGPEDVEEPAAPSCVEKPLRLKPSVATWMLRLPLAQSAEKVAAKEEATAVAVAPAARPLKHMPSVGSWMLPKPAPSAAPVPAPAATPAVASKPLKHLPSVGTWMLPKPKTSFSSSAPLEEPAAKQIKFLPSVGTWMLPKPKTSFASTAPAEAPVAKPLKHMASVGTWMLMKTKPVLAAPAPANEATVAGVAVARPLQFRPSVATWMLHKPILSLEAPSKVEAKAAAAEVAAPARALRHMPSVGTWMLPKQLAIAPAAPAAPAAPPTARALQFLPSVGTWMLQKPKIMSSTPASVEAPLAVSAAPARALRFTPSAASWMLPKVRFAAPAAQTAKEEASPVAQAAPARSLKFLPSVSAWMLPLPRRAASAPEAPKQQLAVEAPAVEMPVVEIPAVEIPAVRAPAAKPPALAQLSEEPLSPVSPPVSPSWSANQRRLIFRDQRTPVARSEEAEEEPVSPGISKRSRTRLLGEAGAREGASNWLSSKMELRMLLSMQSSRAEMTQQPLQAASKPAMSAMEMDLRGDRSGASTPSGALSGAFSAAGMAQASFLPSLTNQKAAPRSGSRTTGLRMAGAGIVGGARMWDVGR